MKHVTQALMIMDRFNELLIFHQDVRHLRAMHAEDLVEFSMLEWLLSKG